MSISKIKASLVLGVLCVLGVCAVAYGSSQYFNLLLATQDLQRSFSEAIAGNLRLIHEAPTFLTIGNLSLIGFLYGAVHAIGPGHGKVIVSGYLLASQSSLRRGLAVTFFSSLLQAVVAVVIVIGLMAIFDKTKQEIEQVAVLVERISFALIGFLGLALFGRGLRSFCEKHLKKSPCSHNAACGCSEGGDTHSAHQKCHHHHHDKGCGCGHAPSASEIEKTEGLLPLVLMVLSIGLRPCSGALLLLFFAALVGVSHAGIVAVFAMSLGTALTTGVIAILTVQSKRVAQRIVDFSDDRLRYCRSIAGMIFGLMIMMLAFLMYSANGFSGGIMSNADSMGSSVTHPLMRSLRP